jgi:hypothetical protein
MKPCYYSVTESTFEGAGDEAEEASARGALRCRQSGDEEVPARGAEDEALLLPCRQSDFRRRWGENDLNVVPEIDATAVWHEFSD